MYTFSIRSTDSARDPGRNLVVINDWRDIFGMVYAFRSQRWFDDKGFMKPWRGTSVEDYIFLGLDDNLAMCVLMNHGGYVPTWDKADRNDFISSRFHNLLDATVPIWSDLETVCVKRNNDYDIVSTNAYFWNEVKRWVNHYWRLLNDYHTNCFKCPMDKESFMQLLEDIYRPESP